MKALRTLLTTLMLIVTCAALAWATVPLCTISGSVPKPDNTPCANCTITFTPTGSVPQIINGTPFYPATVYTTTDASGNLAPISLIQGANMTVTITDPNGQVSGPIQTGVAMNTGETIGQLLANNLLAPGVSTVSGFNVGTKTITFANSPYTVLATDFFIDCDASGGAIVINLPVSSGGGRWLHFKKIDTTANACTLTPNGTDTIDGAATYGLLNQQWAGIYLNDTELGAWRLADKVTSLQNTNICPTAPAPGALLAFDGTTSEWCPATSNIPVNPAIFLTLDARECYDVAVTNGSPTITIVPASDPPFDCGTNTPQFTSADTGKMVKIYTNASSLTEVGDSGTVTYASSTTLTLDHNYAGPTDTCTGGTPACAAILYGTDNGPAANARIQGIPINSYEWWQFPPNSTLLTSQQIDTAGRNMRIMGQVAATDVSGDAATQFQNVLAATWIVPFFSTFQASHAYTLGQQIIDSNQNMQSVTTAGTSDVSAPTWAITIGTPTVSGGATFTLLGPSSVLRERDTFLGAEQGYLMISGDNRPANRPIAALSYVRDGALAGSLYPQSMFHTHDIAIGGLGSFNALGSGTGDDRVFQCGILAEPTGAQDDKGDFERVFTQRVGTTVCNRGAASDEWSLRYVIGSLVGTVYEQSTNNFESFDHLECLNCGLIFDMYNSARANGRSQGAETDWNGTNGTAVNVAPFWEPSRPYSRYAQIEDDSVTSETFYQVTTSGSSGATPPNWATCSPTCTDGTVTWTKITHPFHLYALFAGVGSNLSCTGCGDGGLWSNTAINSDGTIVAGQEGASFALDLPDFELVASSVPNGASTTKFWNLTATGAASRRFTSVPNRGVQMSQFNTTVTVPTTSQVDYIQLCPYPQTITSGGPAGTGACSTNILANGDPIGLDEFRADVMGKGRILGGAFNVPPIPDPITPITNLSCATSGATAYGYMAQGIVTLPNGTTLTTKQSPESCVAGCAATVSGTNNILGQAPAIPFVDTIDIERTPATSSGSFALTATVEPQAITPAATGSSLTFTGKVAGYPPITAGTLVITDSHGLVITDNGIGGCTGTGVTNCTISYANGIYSFTYAPVTGTSWTAAYSAPCGNAGAVGGEEIAESIPARSTVSGSLNTPSFKDTTADGSLTSLPANVNNTGLMQSYSGTITAAPAARGDLLSDFNPVGGTVFANFPTYLTVELGTGTTKAGLLPVPVGVWTFGSTGTADSSGNSNTLSSHGTVTTGQAGPITDDNTTAVLFDGSTGYYSRTSTASLATVLDTETAVCWVRFTSAAAFATVPTIMQQGSTGGFGFFLNSIGYPIVNVTNLGPTMISGTHSVPADSKYHMLLESKNGASGILMMLDRDSIGGTFTNATLAPGAGAITIGAAATGGGNFLGGDIGQCALYAGAFTLRQAQALYDEGFNGKNDSLQYDTTNNCTWTYMNSSGWQNCQCGTRTIGAGATQQPTCSTALQGCTETVTDSNTVTWGDTLVGTSTDVVGGYCDGSNWTVYAK